MAYKVRTRRLAILQSEERLRLSRKLHEGIGQDLLAVKTELQSLSDLSIEQEEQMKQCIAAIDHALKEVRNLSFTLDSSLLNELELGSKKRVLLVDDHRLVRAGIHSLLKQIPDMIVVGETGHGLQAMALIDEQNPDVVLIDIAMLGQNGLAITRQIHEQYPDIKIIIFSMYVNEEYVSDALQAGASAYVLKDSAPPELEIAIRSVCDGGTYLSPMLLQGLRDENKNDEDELFHRLTARQKEVLMLIAEGLSTKEIAAELDISPKTVETHRAQLMDRLGIWDIPSLVKLAIKTGLVAAG